METAKIQQEKKIEEIQTYSDLSKNFKNCKLIHIQILKLIYKEKKPMGFKQIYDKLKMLGTDRTMRSKLYELEQWGLIDAIHSNVFIVLPKSDVEREVVSLMKSFASKIGDTIEL